LNIFTENDGILPPNNLKPAITSQVKQQSTFLEVLHKIATLLKRFLPFVNVVLKQISRIMQSAISGLKELVGKAISFLDAILPDWRNVLRELLKIPQKLITKHLPELPPLVKEVLNTAEMLLHPLLGVKFCEAPQFFKRNSP
jgi:phage-related protein